MPRLTSINPATLEPLGEVEIWDHAAVDAAVRRAWMAFPAWSRATFADRARVIRRARALFAGDRRRMAELITRENGKPLLEAYVSDLFLSLDFLSYYARHAERLLEPRRIPIGKYALARRSSRLEFSPLGVIGIVAPWNFPLSIFMGQAAAALMAGNCVVIKPSEWTPLVALRAAEIFREAGLPEGVLTVAPGDGGTGAALVDADVRKILFTGSVATGRRIAEACGRRLVPVLLELGGKDPMIVLDDADAESTARGAVWGAFFNAGQVCASVERLYVPRRRHAEFVERVAALARRIRQGDGSNPEIDMGPLISERQLAVVERHVADAISRGARAAAGGRRNPALKGYFYEPTVLAEVDRDMAVIREETFGPVLPVVPYDDEDQAVAMANDSPYALTASVWTSDPDRGRRLARRLEAGTVTVNDSAITFGICQTPWGGFKESGIGRSHGAFGVRDVTELRHVHVNRGFRLNRFWWFPYSPAKLSAAADLVAALWARSAGVRIRGVASALARLPRILFRG